MEKLDKIFNPQSVAVVGASNRKGSVGYALMNNLIGSGFDGIIYPINPKRKSILGVRAYPNVSSIQDEVDLVVIATPATTVPSIVHDCGKKGVQGMVIISAGFKEAGKEGNQLMDEISKLAKRYGIRIIGPNCLGFIRPSLKLNASFASKMALCGNIAFISQSGALCTAILDWANKNNVGFSHFVSIGSMMDVGFHDLIDYFGKDPETESILIYMESLSDARKFMSAARAFARTKPIIVLKVGKSSEGAKAAMSHTGSLAGNDAVYDAAFKRAGLIRANTADELFDYAQILATQKRPKGNRLAIITNAGGPGVIATDYLIANGGKLAQFSKKTIDTLNKTMPPTWSRGNPADVLGDAGGDRYKTAIETVVKDKNVDGIVVILTPQYMTDAKAIAKEIVKISKKNDKCILTSWMGGEDVAKGRRIFEQNKIPVYETPEEAVRAFNTMYKYTENLKLLYETPRDTPKSFSPNYNKAKRLISKVMKEKRDALTEEESKELLSYYDIPCAKHGIAKSTGDIKKITNKTGFPVVMKIASPDILHKTDVGGVCVGVKDQKEAEKTFAKIMKSAKKHCPKADIKGVLIEEMVSKKYELLIGCKKDPIFGPTVVFGMGGVTVELFKDTNIGLVPLNMNLAKRLMEETKIYQLIKGYRGMKGADVKAIQFILYKFAYLVMDFPEIKDVDINPFSVDEKGGVVLDAKVILDKSAKDKKPYSHLVISPYPKDLVTKHKLKDNKPVTLRPIRPEDEPLLREMFRKLSRKTQKLRFFEVIKKITHEVLVRYTHNDYDREIAIIGEITEKNKKQMIGVARMIAEPNNNNAEFSLVVADPWQKRGLGKTLVNHMLKIAKQRKIKKIYAKFSKDNKVAETMFKKKQFSISEKDNIMIAEKIP